MAVGVAGSSGSREGVGLGFWRERFGERDNCSLHLLREKARRQNNERESERIGA